MRNFREEHKKLRQDMAMFLIKLVHEAPVVKDDTSIRGYKIKGKSGATLIYKYNEGFFCRRYFVHLNGSQYDIIKLHADDLMDIIDDIKAMGIEANERANNLEGIIAEIYKD